MSEPTFLSVEQVEHFHDQGIKLFGGTLGVRERGLLESAVMQPRNVFFYQQGDLYEIAAAYAFHIAQNQPFLDGNKRGNDCRLGIIGNQRRREEVRPEPAL